VTDSVIVRAFHGERHDHSGCIQDALAVAERVCAERGVRLTKLRRRVLELVWQSHRPQKAYDLLDLLRDENQRAAPPTVYRALEFLHDEGLIHRIESLNAFIGCGDPTQPHGGQFLICRHCGAIAELSDSQINELMDAKAAELGFQVRRRTVELEGECPDCSGRSGAGT